MGVGLDGLAAAAAVGQQPETAATAARVASPGPHRTPVWVRQEAGTHRTSPAPRPPGPTTSPARAGRLRLAAGRAADDPRDAEAVANRVRGLDHGAVAVAAPGPDAHRVADRLARALRAVLPQQPRELQAPAPLGDVERRPPRPRAQVRVGARLEEGPGEREIAPSPRPGAGPSSRSGRPRPGRRPARRSVIACAAVAAHHRRHQAARGLVVGRAGGPRRQDGDDPEERPANLASHHSEPAAACNDAGHPRKVRMPQRLSAAAADPTATATERPRRRG